MQFQTQKKKIITLCLLGAFVLGIIVVFYILNSTANVDTRGKADVATLPENAVNVTFDRVYTPIYRKAQVKLDIIFESKRGISSAGIYLKYPKGVISLDSEASKAISPECLKKYNLPTLTENLAVIETNGLVNISKASLNDSATLPQGKFCFASLVFNVTGIENVTPQYVNFNFEKNLNEWKILSNGDALTPQIVDFAEGQSPYFFFCLGNEFGDATCDNSIDLSDFEKFRKDFLSLRGKPLEDNIYITTDFNRDGSIDLADFELFRGGFMRFLKEKLIKPTPTPPTGCYYKQVQCIQAPCNPILICPSGVTVTPLATTTPVSCGWCGNTCLPDGHKRLCPAVMPPEDRECKLVVNVCTDVLKN
jgi:hypothetical protein